MTDNGYENSSWAFHLNGTAGLSFWNYAYTNTATFYSKNLLTNGEYTTIGFPFKNNRMVKCFYGYLSSAPTVGSPISL